VNGLPMNVEVHTAELPGGSRPFLSSFFAGRQLLNEIHGEGEIVGGEAYVQP